MIKLSSFFPFSSFLRITQEFHETKALVKMKSLTHESEFEFAYKDVGEISERFSIDNSQATFSFSLLAFTTLISYLLTGIFCSFLLAHPILLRIEQILYVCGLLLFIISFKKSLHVRIADKNDTILTYLQSNRQNRALIPQVIETIKDKAESTNVVTIAEPFPQQKPVFEHVYFDSSDMIKTIDRFYENEVIGFQKNLLTESVYSIRYSQFTGKVYRGKSGSDILGFSLSIALTIISITAGFFFAFGTEFGIAFPRSLGYLLITLLVLSLLTWPFAFLKRETIGLYGKNENIAYWTYVNKTNKEKVEEIIRFIQSRITPATDNELLKEQV